MPSNADARPRLRLLCPLDGIPVAKHLGGVDSRGLQRGLDRVAGGHRGLIPENVRVAADQLAVQAGDHIRDGKVAGLARHLGIKEHLQQKVAQLLAQIAPMPALDGIEDLVAFLEGIFPDGVEALLAIPGAAIGTAQAGHDAHGFGEKCSRIGGRVALRAHSNNVNDALEDCVAPVTVVCWTHASPKTSNDSLYLFRIVRLAAGQFPECLHPPAARGRIGGVAAVALPPVQPADRQPGQHSGSELADVGGRMPGLRKPHLLALSSH